MPISGFPFYCINAGIQFLHSTAVVQTSLIRTFNNCNTTISHSIISGGYFVNDGPSTTLGYNLLTYPAQFIGNTSLDQFVDAKLRPFGIYGNGNWETFIPDQCSPAINAGLLTIAATDQNGKLPK